MAEKLASHVHVYDDAGVAHEFYPGDDVPDWARDKITNPDVWSDGSDADNGRPAKSDNKAAWVDHAVAHGADRDEAEAMTKDELVEQYG